MKRIENILNDENNKMKIYKIKNVVRKTCKVTIPILEMLMASSLVTDKLDDLRYYGNVGYDDTVKAIMNSGMYSSDKTKLVTMLTRGETSEFYRAIIDVVRSNMYSSDKVKLIQNMHSTQCLATEEKA